MLNLLVKDIIVQKKTLMFAVLYPIFIFFAFNNPIFANFIYTMGALIIANVLIITATYTDEVNKSYIMLNSLPLSRSDIIKERYISVPFFAIFSLTIIVILGQIFNWLPLPFNNFRMVTWLDVFIIICSVSFLASLCLPFYYRFGYTAIRIVNIFIFIILFFAPAAFMGFIQENQDSQLVQSLLTWINNTSDWVLGFFILSITALIFTISYLTSLRIYIKKDL